MGGALCSREKMSGSILRMVASAPSMQKRRHAISSAIDSCIPERQAIKAPESKVVMGKLKVVLTGMNYMLHSCACGYMHQRLAIQHIATISILLYKIPPDPEQSHGGVKAYSYVHNPRQRNLGLAGLFR